VLGAACTEAEIPILHISTDYVFDDTKLEAYVESDPINPINAYGYSKASGETTLRHIQPLHVILRTSWQHGELGKNFLKTIVRLAGTARGVAVGADQLGSPTSTRDVADAILRIAPRLVLGEKVWGTYPSPGSA
jgi:dTDP-4-dehydrorhamnose reductase